MTKIVYNAYLLRYINIIKKKEAMPVLADIASDESLPRPT